MIDPQNPLLAVAAPALNRPGRPSARTRTGIVGEGSAWLLFDAGGDLFQYQCYWFGGSGGDQLLEHARAATAADAVKWASARTPRSRLRSPDHRTYWAGTGPNPGGFSGTWPAGRPERHPAVYVAPAREIGYHQPEPALSRIRDTVGARS